MTRTTKSKCIVARPTSFSQSLLFFFFFFYFPSAMTISLSLSFFRVFSIPCDATMLLFRLCGPPNILFSNIYICFRPTDFGRLRKDWKRFRRVRSVPEPWKFGMSSLVQRPSAPSMWIPSHTRQLDSPWKRQIDGPSIELRWIFSFLHPSHFLC